MKAMGEQMQDFNTMQQLFATNMQNIMTGQQRQNSPPITDFNTMQQLFATGQHQQLQKQTQSLQYTQDQPQIKKEHPPSSADEFNTMQNLFATNTMPQQQQQLKHQIPQNIDINDFNTMQNLFATNSFSKPAEKSEDPFSLLTSG